MSLVAKWFSYSVARWLAVNLLAAVPGSESLFPTVTPRDAAGSLCITVKTSGLRKRPASKTKIICNSCPIRVKMEDLNPGPLIFQSAWYTNEPPHVASKRLNRVTDLPYIPG